MFTLASTLSAEHVFVNNISKADNNYNNNKGMPRHWAMSNTPRNPICPIYLIVDAVRSDCSSRCDLWAIQKPRCIISRGAKRDDVTVIGQAKLEWHGEY